MSIIAGQGEGGSRTVLDYLPKVFPVETGVTYGVVSHFVAPAPVAATVVLLAFALTTPLALWWHGLRVQQTPPLPQYVIRIAAFFAWSFHTEAPLLWHPVLSNRVLSAIAVVVGLVALLVLHHASRKANGRNSWI
jgi:hypothetical protein